MYIKSIVVSLQSKQKQKDMAYVKIADRNLKEVEVIIISKKLGIHKKMVREDRVNRYVSDYILFNKLKGTPYLIKTI